MLTPEKLLPCPFCGGKANIVGVGTAKGMTWTVFCNAIEPCDAQIQTLTESEAFASWNRRATSSLASASAGDGELIQWLEKIDKFDDGMTTYRNPDGPPAAARLRSLAGEVAEAREWARAWHKCVETTLTILQTNPTLGADDAPAAIQERVSNLQRAEYEQRTRAESAERDLHAALERVGRLEKALTETTKQNENMLRAINWACGCSVDGFVPPERSDRPYWWREGLTHRADLQYNRETGQYRARTTLEGRDG